MPLRSGQKQLSSILILSCTIAGTQFLDPPAVFAQKQYYDAFVAKYGNLAQAANVQKCGVCHGKQKTQRNKYAKTLEGFLPGRRIKNAAAITAALEKAGEQKLPNGMKYDDLLRAGNLPAPFPN